MTMSPAYHDLSHHLQREIGELIQRHANVARSVLEPVEITLMMVEASVSLALTTAATSAASARPGADIHDLYDSTIGAIVASIASERDRSLAAVDAKLKESASS